MSNQKNQDEIVKGAYPNHTTPEGHALALGEMLNAHFGATTEEEQLNTATSLMRYTQDVAPVTTNGKAAPDAINTLSIRAMLHVARSVVFYGVQQVRTPESPFFSKLMVKRREDFNAWANQFSELVHEVNVNTLAPLR